MKRGSGLVFLACLAALAGCKGETERAEPAAGQVASAAGLPTPEDFAKQYPKFESFWYQGQAELTRYALRQARYGDLHDGEAVLVFVTEDFLPKLQVKQERGESPDAISVLKLNANRRFYTGVYPYTIMTSSFTPARGAPALKLSSTIQEWCGQVYTQINRRSDGLRVHSHSYFQDDGDQEMTMPNVPLEDELWAQIRIDPSKLPQGEVQLVPGLDYVRMRHKALRAYPATVSVESNVQTELVDHPVEALRLSYAHIGRELVVYFEAAFPHVIQAWEEKIGPKRTTAVRTHAIMDAYWNHNGAGDAKYREALGLSH